MDKASSIENSRHLQQMQPGAKGAHNSQPLIRDYFAVGKGDRIALTELLEDLKEASIRFGTISTKNEFSEQEKEELDKLYNWYRSMIDECTPLLHKYVQEPLDVILKHFKVIEEKNKPYTMLYRTQMKRLQTMTDNLNKKLEIVLKEMPAEKPRVVDIVAKVEAPVIVVEASKTETLLKLLSTNVAKLLQLIPNYRRSSVPIRSLVDKVNEQLFSMQINREIIAGMDNSTHQVVENFEEIQGLIKEIDHLLHQLQKLHSPVKLYNEENIFVEIGRLVHLIQLNKGADANSWFGLFNRCAYLEGMLSLLGYVNAENLEILNEWTVKSPKTVISIDPKKNYVPECQSYLIADREYVIGRAKLSPIKSEYFWYDKDGRFMMAELTNGMNPVGKWAIKRLEDKEWIDISYQWLDEKPLVSSTIQVNKSEFLPEETKETVVNLIDELVKLIPSHWDYPKSLSGGNLSLIYDQRGQYYLTHSRGTKESYLKAWRPEGYEEDLFKVALMFMEKMDEIEEALSIILPILQELRINLPADNKFAHLTECLRIIKNEPEQLSIDVVYTIVTIMLGFQWMSTKIRNKNLSSADLKLWLESDGTINTKIKTKYSGLRNCIAMLPFSIMGWPDGESFCWEEDHGSEVVRMRTISVGNERAFQKFDGEKWCSCESWAEQKTNELNLEQMKRLGQSEKAESETKLEKIEKVYKPEKYEKKDRLQELQLELKSLLHDLPNPRTFSIRRDELKTLELELIAEARRNNNNRNILRPIRLTEELDIFYAQLQIEINSEKLQNIIELLKSFPEGQSGIINRIQYLLDLLTKMQKFNNCTLPGLSRVFEFIHQIENLVQLLKENPRDVNQILALWLPAEHIERVVVKTEFHGYQLCKPVVIEGNEQLCWFKSEESNEIYWEEAVIEEDAFLVLRQGLLFEENGVMIVRDITGVTKKLID